MKNTNKIFTLILLLCMVLCSCSSAVVETTVQPTAQPTPTPTPTPMPTSVEDIGQIVYDVGGALRENLSGKLYMDGDFDKNGLPCLQEEHNMLQKNIDDSLAQNITWNYLGVDFELEYECSKFCHINNTFTDDYIDVYSTSRPSDLEVGFLHGTRLPLYIQYDGKKYNDALEHIDYNNLEEDYVNVIKLNNQAFSKDFTDYKLECVITYDDFDGEKVTYTNLDDIKNTGRKIFRVEVSYYPKEISGLRLESYPNFWMNKNTWVIIYAETDFSGYTDLVKISQSTLQYAYDEALKFAKENFHCVNIELDTVDFKLSEIPFIPSETTLEVVNGRLYLILRIHLFGEWGSDEQGAFDSVFGLGVDYQRLQWKMALEDKT